jgi:hypothetical protein
MSDILTNPFTEGYVTHTVTERQFAQFFSPELVDSARAIFQTGNVIVRGTQGSGKSMLLRLLDPTIRRAYHELEKERKLTKTEQFPIPEELRDFVSAKVDLNKSGLLDIVNTLPPDHEHSDIQFLALAFGDFLNFWLLYGLLDNIDWMRKHSEVFEHLVGGQEQLDSFASSFAREECFFGSLDRVVGWQALKDVVRERVIHYRAWANGNRDLPPAVRETKTSIGEPLGRSVKALHVSGALTRTTHVFFAIDQIEALWFQKETKRSLGMVLRREIHQLLGSRDNRAYYRIGVRRHDWGENSDLAMRDGRNLEEGRDYLITDIDDLLRKGEYAKNWTFKRFARDVFERRVKATFVDFTGLPESLHQTSDFFGSSPEPQDLVAEIIKKPDETGRKLLMLDKDWPEEWTSAIMDCYHRRVANLPMEPRKECKYDPLNALLLSAWGLQTGGRGRKAAKQRRFDSRSPGGASEPPWNQAKYYWRKERYPLAIVQLCSRHGQKLQWWGERKVLSLSGGNILRFITISRLAWDYWQRVDAQTAVAKHKIPIVETSTQASAILEASRQIRESLRRQPGNPAGDVRIRFLDKLAQWMRDKLLADVAMRYPGGNGFSLRDDELAKHPDLKRLIHEAVGWGDLYEREHTSKIKNDGKRTKYYPNPSLSPVYQLHESHTKEPLYVTAKEILQIANAAGVVVNSRKPAPQEESNSQLLLFQDP